MEENINKKNNIQVNALNVGTEKASSKYYSYQNDSTDIIQANTNKFNKNQENSLMKEGGFFMPINQNLFEEELDEFFNNLINSYLNYLSQEDETYKRLGKNKNSCIENFLKDFPNTNDSLEKLINYIYLENEYESNVLYRQGFIDCFNFLKLLDY